MRAFTKLDGIAAALPLRNVDTDKILPGAFLKTVSREGLGKALFAAMRYRDDGAEREDFVLNREPWRIAVILVTGENFGCGSSREHAPWALLEFGIRCIIASGFADIFRNNCYKNGILPIALEAAVVARLMADACDPAAATLAIDLELQTITRSSGEQIGFEIDPQRKAALIEGLDDIAVSLTHSAEIDAFEATRAGQAPWIEAGLAKRLAAVLETKP